VSLLADRYRIPICTRYVTRPKRQEAFVHIEDIFRALFDPEIFPSPIARLTPQPVPEFLVLDKSLERVRDKHWIGTWYRQSSDIVDNGVRSGIGYGNNAGDSVEGSLEDGAPGSV
jgi:hypothetical protein